MDLAGLDLPDPDVPVPVRFLGHWDAVLLTHARRTGVLPEDIRSRIFASSNPFSVGTVLIDGRVVASWSLRAHRIEVVPYGPIPTAVAHELEAEREALEAFHA